MTTKKQIEANKQNASLSTGAVTEEGKAIVSKNAVKHGIFTNDLVISAGDGKESEDEYNQLLENLIESLKPNGQMEHLLVEKIAIDTWRLRRVLRFETGSIRQTLDTVVYDYYNNTGSYSFCKRETNEELQQKINEKQKWLSWAAELSYTIKKGAVKFDEPVWRIGELECDVEDLLYVVIRSIEGEVLTVQERDLYEMRELTFKQQYEIIKRAGYTEEDIAAELVSYFEQETKEHQQEIYDLERQKLKNELAEDVGKKIHSLPSIENIGKIMRYETTIQKSIFQNLALLKKLQELP